MIVAKKMEDPVVEKVSKPQTEISKFESENFSQYEHSQHL